jgi:hypothetical protein
VLSFKPTGLILLGLYGDRSEPATYFYAPFIHIYVLSDFLRRGSLYLLVDTMLTQLEATASLNILAYARYLARLSPPPLLTLEDYVLAHEVLCEAVQSQGSVLRPADLQADSLLLLDDLHVERQFCLATSLPLCRLALPVNPFQASAALHPANQSKNNSLDFVAVDWSRVHLTEWRRASLASMHSDLTSGEDYVNASWVPGYAGPREFVLSHHPGPGSLAQFWRMVHITRAPLVVCLSIVPQSFWPLDASAPPLRFELSGGGGNSGGRQLVVWLESEGFTGGYRSARISLSVIGCDVAAAAAAGGGDDVTSVQLIFCPNWPHQSIPVSNCVHLVDMVAKLLPGDGDGGGPVVVMDSFGATEAAIFCVLSSLVRQMDLEVLDYLLKGQSQE